MKKLIALLLVLSMLFAMSACKQDESEDKKKETTEETEETGGETEPSTEETEPTEEPDPVDPITFEGLSLSYILTDRDVDAFYDLLEQCEEIALAGEDEDAIDEISDELELKFNFIEDQASIAQIIYYCDMSDEEASERFLDCSDIVSEVQNEMKLMMRRVYESDSPAKDILFEDWTQQELDMLMNHSDEVMELEKRNAEILVEYQALKDRASDDMVPLYLEQVQNNNRIAQIYGFDNFYDYAHSLGYNRDYSYEQLEDMRGYVANYLAPAVSDAYDAFFDAMQALSMDEQLLLIELMEADYDDMDENYLTDYLASLPKDVRQGMEEALQEENSYFTDYKHAQEGAFTAVFSDRCFCFFGPGYANSMTVAHELGHYYGGHFADLDLLSLDLAETQSQGNEWLFVGYLSETLDPEVFEALVSYKLYENTTTILICVLVDEFEQRLYACEDIESLDADDLYDMMEDICDLYGGYDYIEAYSTDIHSYWRNVVVENPAYYISYAVSAVAAMNVYTIYEEDPDAALTAYRGVVENDGTLSFLETLEDAGLPGPFDRSFYEDLANLLDGY